MHSRISVVGIHRPFTNTTTTSTTTNKKHKKEERKEG
jgi:hypothetical protein